MVTCIRLPVAATARVTVFALMLCVPAGPAQGQVQGQAQVQWKARELGRWRPMIAEASARFMIPQLWIEQVMQAESAGRTHRGGQPIRSSRGAIGLMQLMPGTWAEMRAALGLGYDPDEPRDNILAGTYYLRLLYDQYGHPGLFAAYNAGPARYRRYLAGEPLPGETRRYLGAILGWQASTPFLGGQGSRSNTPMRLQPPGPTARRASSQPSPQSLSQENPPSAALFAVRRAAPANGSEPGETGRDRASRMQGPFAIRRGAERDDAP